MELEKKKKAVVNRMQELELFDIFSVTVDDTECMLLQSEQNIDNGVCLISLTIEETSFNTIHYFIGTLPKEELRPQILELFNELNLNNLLVKYYLEDDSVIGRVTYISRSFDANDYVDLITAGYNSIAEEYWKIMKILRP